MNLILASYFQCLELWILDEVLPQLLRITDVFHNARFRWLLASSCCSYDGSTCRCRSTVHEVSGGIGDAETGD